MIDNKFGFYPDIDLDLDQLREIVLRRVSDASVDLKPHQRLVEHEPYLVELRNRYPFLSTLYNIYLTGAGRDIPVHIDSGRNCALNIPIHNTEDTHTVFYSVEDAGDVTNIEKYVFDFVKSKTQEIYRFTLTQPTVMNTKIPHSVIGHPWHDRIVMSWSVEGNVSYQDLRTKFELKP
jgi:hypothetical protein